MQKYQFYFSGFSLYCFPKKGEKRLTHTTPKETQSYYSPYENRGAIYFRDVKKKLFIAYLHAVTIYTESSGCMCDYTNAFYIAHGFRVYDKNDKK